MASIKVKFRSSIVSGKEGILYYQIIYRRVIRQLTTIHYIYSVKFRLIGYLCISVI